VLDPLATLVIDSTISEGDKIHVCVAGEKMELEGLEGDGEGDGSLVRLKTPVVTGQANKDTKLHFYKVIKSTSTST
tara:strand:+ start:646 stop:873 length:228 start_codon:yes stop_codon:yes gene_type:complete